MLLTALCAFITLTTASYLMLRRKDIGPNHFIALIVLSFFVSITASKWKDLQRLSMIGYSVELLEDAKSRLTEIYRLQLIILSRTDALFLSEQYATTKDYQTLFKIFEAVDNLELGNDLQSEICTASTNILEEQYEYVKYFSQTESITDAFSYSNETGEQNIPNQQAIKNAHIDNANLEKASSHLEIPILETKNKLSQAVNSYKEIWTAYTQRCM